MAVVTEQPVWVTGITQIDPNDPVQGGAGGVDNVPHEQLANRTLYLKNQLENLQIPADSSDDLTEEARLRKEADDALRGEPTESVTLASLLARIKYLEEAPNDNLTFLPVGGLFETTVVYSSGAEVAAAMGYGTWQRFAEGRVTVGVSSKVADAAWTKVIGAEYGEDEVTLTVDAIPEHKHSKGDKFKYFMAKYFKADSIGQGDSVQTSQEWQTHGITATEFLEAAEQSVGGGESHNNVQPSVVVGKWVRTA